MQLHGRFSPHPRGFGFIDLDAPATLTSERGTAVTVDSIFVAPDVARGWLDGDQVTVTAEVDDQDRVNAVELGLVTRPRRFVVGDAITFAGKVVLRLDPRVGAGQIKLTPALSEQLMRADGRQVVVTAGNAEDGRAIGSSLVAGPDPIGGPTALRSRAVIIAHGKAAPDAIPGGPEAVGLPVAETLGTALRAMGHLAGGREGLAAGLGADIGPVPGVEHPLADLRDQVAITIDDDSARDLDDALTATWSGEADDLVHMTVHIADAAGTVGIGSPADNYAATMGTTSYFVSGPNAPMLDPILSEGELSLLPGQPRRVIAVSFDIDPDGKTSSPELDTAWIETTARLSYAAVDAFLEDADAAHLLTGAHGPSGVAMAKLGPVRQTVTALAEASRRLGVERDGRDTLEGLFEPATLEATTVDGKIRTIPADPHPVAQKVVERAMVACNEAVAGWAAVRGVPLLYRSHVGFDPERLPRLMDAAAELKISLTEEADGMPTPADILRLIDELKAEGRDRAAALLATTATGVVARATYTSDPDGHVAMGSGAYTHFTSPIRRYADLVVHRQIRATIADEAAPYTAEQLTALATWLDVRAGAANHAQSLERNGLWGVLLDRGAVTWPSEAVVTAVTANGVRVRLIAAGVGGFISAANALGMSPKDRPVLKVDEHGLATVDLKWHVGHRVMVRLDRVDDMGRPELKPAN